MLKWATKGKALAGLAIQVAGLLVAAACDSGTAPAATAAVDTAVASDTNGGDSSGSGADTSVAADGAGNGASDAAATPFVPGDPPAGWQPVGYGQNGDMAVEVFAPQALTMGQNYLAYRVTAQGAQASAARILQVPHMGMAGAEHGCPVIDPPDAADDLALFQGISVFQMASTVDAPWRLDLNVEVPLGAAPRAVSIDNLTVTKSAWVATAKAADGTQVIVSLYFPKKPKVGLNPYTLTVHADAGDDVTFPAIADATVKATPLMVTMGHGSSGNVAPVAKGGGLYAGKASFSMPGEWKLTFAITAGGKSLGSAAFKIVL